MKDFLLIFRSDYYQNPVSTPEEMEANMKRWIDWLSSLAQQGQLTDQGNRLDRGGKVLKPENVVTNGPYTEIKEAIGGYSIIKATSYDEAVEISKGCPIFNVGGNVEIREIITM
jgi:hypothetical protein